MGALTSWIYPLRGVLFLLTTPQLLQMVLRFLGIVTAASAASTLACFVLLWRPHMHLLGRLLGEHLLTRLLVSLLLLAEAALPVTLIFKKRMERLGEQLFDRTLALKTGRAASAVGAAAAAPAPAAAARVPSVAPLHASDAAALASLREAKRRQAAGRRQQQTALLSSVAAGLWGFAVRLLLKPRPNEGVLIRKARDAVTLGAAALLPGAALLLPLAVYRDSGAEVGNLLARYLAAKGIADNDSQEAVVAARMGELRGFALVATGLSYLPVVNWGLALSNHVAAALYAAHLEAKGGPLLRQGWLS